MKQRSLIPFIGILIFFAGNAIFTQIELRNSMRLLDNIKTENHKLAVACFHEGYAFGKLDYVAMEAKAAGMEPPKTFEITEGCK